MVYDISDFSEGLKEAESTGGVTGSVCVEREGTKHQFKFSILDLLPVNLRRIKANGTDRENLGEVFSGRVARSLLGELAPEVSTVYDGAKKRIAIVSKYLDNVYEGTLDHYLASINGPFERKHAHVVLQAKGDFIPKEQQDKSALYLDEDSPLAESMADALAVSALLGDHDVNPGNMIVTQDPTTGELRVGRIDFGHACNDLLNAPKVLGGKLLDTQNPIFDFFNRKSVAGARRGGDPSKLWRDYEGFVPSVVLAEALLRLGEKQVKLRVGLENAKQEFFDLADKIDRNPNDKKSREHLVKSLDAMHHAVTGQHLNPNVITHNQMVACFKSLDAFVMNNAKNATKAGNMMKLQAEFNQAIKTMLNTPINKRDKNSYETLLKTWQDKFQESGLINKKDGSLPWFKTEKESEPFVGNITEYCINQTIINTHKNLTHKPSIKLYARLKENMRILIAFAKNYFKNKEDPSELLQEAEVLEQEVDTKQDLLSYAEQTDTQVFDPAAHEKPSIKERYAQQKELQNPAAGRRRDIESQ
jgi:hypothetical protein